MKYRYFIFLILLVGLAIEALLAIRVWAQLTSKPTDESPMVSLFKLTDDLAEPFAVVTGRMPLQASGVVDYTVLVAIEFYFAAMLVLVAFAFVIGRLKALTRSRRRLVSRKALSASDVGPNTRRSIWQPVSTERIQGASFYVALDFPPGTPAQAKPNVVPRPFTSP